jgi:tetratricopeptide (TPR) repeat protein
LHHQILRGAPQLAPPESARARPVPRQLPVPPASFTGRADELLTWCGGLPLALAVVAARATVRPGQSLAGLAAELREAPLDALDALDMTANVRAVLSWSTRGLDADTGRVFRLLASAPGPDIGLAAASALAALPEARTRAVLRALENANLLTRDAQDRYRMHDLIRLFGAETAKDDTSVPAALRALVEFLLHTAQEADRLCYPYRLPVDVGPSTVDTTTLPDRVTAQQWFITEHTNLLAAQQLQGRLGDFRQGRVNCERALALHRGQRNGEGVAEALGSLGFLAHHEGCHDDAIDYYEQALDVCREAGHVQGIAELLGRLGEVYADTGRTDQAREHWQRSLELYEGQHSAANAGRVRQQLDSLVATS